MNPDAQNFVPGGRGGYRGRGRGNYNNNYQQYGQYQQFGQYGQQYQQYPQYPPQFQQQYQQQQQQFNPQQQQYQPRFNNQYNNQQQYYNNNNGWQQQQQQQQQPPQQQPVQQQTQQPQQPPAPVPQTVDPRNDPKLQAGGTTTAAPIKKGTGKKLVLTGSKPATSATPATPATPTTPTAPTGDASVAAGGQTQQQETKVLSKEERREAAAKEALSKRKSTKTYVRDPRPHFSIVFCGHVDAGKSTISGQLMLEAGLVDDREMEKLKRDAEANKREGWEFAYVFDVSEEERAKGKTHETGAGYFETKDRRITILDAPGHKAFVPSMIGGASQAEVAVLVISARKGEFEAGFDRGGQTREHVLLLRTCGVKQMICVINKMDEAEWSKDRYDDILSKLRPFLRANGYDEANGTLVFIPVAGLKGYNLTKHAPEGVCDWFEGPNVIDYINKLELQDTRKENDILAVPLVGAYKDEGKVYLYGKCESGSIELGDKLQILPTKTEVVVEGITIENTELEKCYPGDNVHIRVRGVDEADIHGGYMLTCIPSTLRAVDYIQARVTILEIHNILTKGSKLMLHIHTAQEECTVDRILATLDKKTSAVIQKDPQYVKAGDMMMVRLELERPLVVETHTDFDKLSRFMLREEGKTVALGVVTKLYETTKEQAKQNAAASAS